MFRGVINPDDQDVVFLKQSLYALQPQLGHSEMLMGFLTKVPSGTFMRDNNNGNNLKGNNM